MKPASSPFRTGPKAELAVESWPIDRPIPYPNNPRVVPQSAIDKVAVSITQFGFRQPIVVDEQAFVIVGHTRLLAAKQLALAEVPVHVACDLRTAFTMKG